MKDVSVEEEIITLTKLSWAYRSRKVKLQLVNVHDFSIPYFSLDVKQRWSSGIPGGELTENLEY